MLRFISLVIISLVFVSCSQKIPYASSKAYFVVIKNAKIALADTGFIKKDNERFNLQLFSASTPIFDLHVKDNVCIGFTCLDKKSFNKEFFGFEHYENLIQELFDMQPIYNKTNIVRFEGGFEQDIISDDYDISYKVDNGNLYFKDSKNKILIKLKELKE